MLGYGAWKYGDHLDLSQEKVVRKTLPNFFGSAAFLFCIHIAVLPIAQSMKKRAKFRKVSTRHPSKAHYGEWGDSNQALPPPWPL